MIEILNLEEQSDRDIYLNAIDLTQDKSPYNSISFFRFFSSGLKNLICLKYKVNGEIILLPGYLRDIPFTNGLRDFISPYGYSGPVFNPAMDNEILLDFWKSSGQWFKSENIITAFIRFSLNGNHLNFPGQLHCTMLNIKGKILSSEDEQWQKYDRKVRKNVNKAEREGLISEIIPGENVSSNQLITFCDIYFSTMRRTNANNSFFYDIQDFRQFLVENSKSTVFIFVKDKELITSAEMILLSNDSAYSFLGGTLDDHFSNRPNDLLKHDIIKWLRSKNYKFFILGGGYGMEDGIYRYKKSFFPSDVKEYYTGRIVYNEDVYIELIEQTNDRRLKSGLPQLDYTDISFFPLYRKLN